MLTLTESHVQEIWTVQRFTIFSVREQLQQRIWIGDAPWIEQEAQICQPDELRALTFALSGHSDTAGGDKTNVYSLRSSRRSLLDRPVPGVRGVFGGFNIHFFRARSGPLCFHDGEILSRCCSQSMRFRLSFCLSSRPSPWRNAFQLACYLDSFFG